MDDQIGARRRARARRSPSSTALVVEVARDGCRGPGPRCQSEVCRTRIEVARAIRIRACRRARCAFAVAVRGASLGDVGRERREREPQRDRRRDQRLVEHHRAGQEARRALAQLGRQEPVLARLAGVEPPDDLERGVADDRCRRRRPRCCWAPMSRTPRLRPRAAMSTSTSLIGLEPCRGAYLLSSSRTMKRSGSRPCPASPRRSAEAARRRRSAGRRRGGRGCRRR